MNVLTDDWPGLYAERWGNDCAPAALAHPAKFSRALIRRIYEHAVAEGWLCSGDTVLDPFAGVALGALDALRLGLCWLGVELEPKFVALGRQNIGMWDNRYGSLLQRWGRAALVQGDSRRLVEVLSEAPEINCAISSPPYVDSRVESDLQRQAQAITVRIQDVQPGYGNSSGQLAAMPEGNVQAVISSPPYESSMERWGKEPSAMMQAYGLTARYGDSNGQLATAGEDFWSAAYLVVAQTFALVRPGGHAIFVTKNFVREGKVVEFSQQWAQLCEACGFRLAHWHRAWQVEHNGTAFTLDGGNVERKVSRKGFFRRLYESKHPENAIDWEDVLCFSKLA
jgi:hypothetical protein